MPQALRLTDYGAVDVDIQRTVHGGFGVVYMGPDRLWNGRWHVLKTLRPEVLERSPRARDLFVRESLIWCGLWTHANLLLAQSVTDINARPFLVLEYAEGGNLRDALQTPRPLSIRLAWAQHIAAGLHILHTPDLPFLRPDPLVHRDLKPENVLLRTVGGHVYAQITDFGLAKAMDGDAVAPSLLPAAGEDDAPTRSRRVQTARGAALGTPAYMAPEQWEDAASAGPPADLYAFGLMLSELFAGRHALLDLAGGHGVETWRRAHAQQTPRRLREMAPELPRALDDLYQACLAKHPQQRPTAHETLRALQGAAQALGQQPYMVPDVFAHSPEHERAKWLNWAIAHRRFALYPEALERIDRAFALDPHNADVLVERGIILGALGRVDEALAAYDAAMAATPPEDRVGRHMIWYDLGSLLNEVGRYPEAEAAYVQALALVPDDADAWYNRANNERAWGLTEARMGRMAEARAHLTSGVRHIERAIALNPNDPDHPGLLAHLREDLARLGG